MFFQSVKFSIVLVLLFSSFIVNSQNSFSDRTLSFFTSLWKNIPQEKVYLHTDKPYYSAGEDIWFNAYLINAATHLPTTKSRFVYVELINSFDSVLQRVKIRKDSLGFSGHLKLSAETPAGGYVLRAYTYWMQNSGTEFFFNKQLKIGNKIDDRLQTIIRFGEILNNYQTVTVFLYDANSKPLTGKSVRLSMSGFKKSIKPIVLKSNLKGELSWRIPVDSVSDSKKAINLMLDDSSLKFSKQFNVPTSFDDFDVQFFPESGSLIKENVQSIAFKAIGSNGLSINVTGKVYDDKNNEIAELSNTYKGMGKFSLFPQFGTKYYAVLKNEKGLEKRFSLPYVEDKGISLKVIANKGKIYYDINNQLPESQNQLYMLILCVAAYKIFKWTD